MLIEQIKQAAMDAVRASKPTQLVYGTVQSISPVKVKVSDKLILPGEVLVIPRELTDHDITLEWTDSEGITRQTTYTAKTGIKTGEKLVMLRNQGGQKYIVIGRVVS